MTLAELVAEAERETLWTPGAIRALVRSAWPAHTVFTPTQAALVVNHIQRREAKR